MRILPLCIFASITYFMIGEREEEKERRRKRKREAGSVERRRNCRGRRKSISEVSRFSLGFQLDVAKFFIFFLSLNLVSIAASSSAFWVSAGVTVAGLANLLVALTYVVQMVS